MNPAKMIRPIVKRCSLLAAVTGSLLISTLNFASFERAMEIYSSGDFEQAKAAFEALAAIGDQSSLFNLGVMHYRGEATEQDPVRAYALIQISNRGISGNSYANVASQISSQFSEAQKAQAQELIAQLEPVYGADGIRENIYPKLLNDEDCLPEAKPLRKESAAYPKKELRQGIMGVTTVEFTISPEGYPRDVVVLKTTNMNFARNTLRAVDRLLYEPLVHEEPVYGHRHAFSYHITDSGGAEVKIRTQSLSKRLEALKSEAEQGDAIAQYSYASTLNTYRFFRKYLEKVDVQYRTANEWFEKSAAGGLPHAQFEIGRNMIEGRGCEVDKANGMKWVNAAAHSGYSPAQRMLARSALSEADTLEVKHHAAMSWLRNAALSDDYPAKLLLAWELVTSPNSQIRDANEAFELLESKPENYYDKLRIAETKAAAYAEAGDFKNAIKFQKKAARLAIKREWTIPLVEERLALYEQQQPYRGRYF